MQLYPHVMDESPMPQDGSTTRSSPGITAGYCAWLYPPWLCSKQLPCRAGPPRAARREGAPAAAELPEFKGNVAAVDSRPFWREADVSPKNQGYHYNHNAETYMEVGLALGWAMADLESR